MLDILILFFVNRRPDAFAITAAYYTEASHAGEYEYKLNMNLCFNSSLRIMSDNTFYVIFPLHITASDRH